MLETLPDSTLAAFAGGAGGIALGLAARLGRFCTLGGIEDWLYGGDGTRLRMWICAMAVAILGVSALSLGGGLVWAEIFYLNMPFSPVLAIAGGLVFGYGMALAGNCGFGALARLGGGDLRSLMIVLVMGLAAYATLSGPLALARVMATNATSVDFPIRGFAHLAQAWFGLSPGVFGIGIGAVLFLATVLGPGLMKSPRSMIWAIVVGIAIASGWAATQWIATNGFDGVPVVSHTYTAPLGGTVIYLMTSSAGGLNFAVGSVLGVLFGAAVGSLIKGQFRWEACDDPRELRRQIAGAILMGVGGVFAGGCTIGQGVSAMSVLSYSAPLVFGSIVLGAAVGLRHLIVGRVMP